ncbi:MAG: hypothetical protein OEW16_08575 [Gammaproteobacteria bacterium]|nr:hypothetical protein [Gammaproteobacteria bacterium]
MNPFRCLLLMAFACAACSTGGEVPVDVHVVEAPNLLVGVPARLLLDVRTGVPTAGVEIAVEGDGGLSVVDFAPRVLPATQPTGGSQLFVDLLPAAGGNCVLTVRLVVHMGGDKSTRTVTLPLLVSRPTEALPQPEASPGAGT